MNWKIYDLSRSEWESLIDEWIFNKTHRDILKRRMLDGYTYDELSMMFNLSNERVRRIIYKSQDILINHIKRGE